MMEAVLNSEYFQERIQSLRQKLHAMEGFKPVEKISENVPELSPNTDSVSLVVGKEKDGHEK